MITRTVAPQPVCIPVDAILAAKEVPVREGDVLVLRGADGRETLLPPSVSDFLLQTIVTVADHRTATIAHVPDELLAPFAAELLGVSRQALMRLAEEGAIATAGEEGAEAFRRDDLLRLKEDREIQRRKAVRDVRASDEEAGLRFLEG